MTKYILHGGFTRYDNELNRAYFAEIMKDVPDGGNVLLVFFATKEGDTTEKFKELSEELQNAAGSKNIKFVHASKEMFIEQLKQADAIHFQGGSTNLLLETLNPYENLRQHFAEKTIAGSSAGAYMLAAYGTAHAEEHMREGLGILPVRLICHYESSELPPSESSVSELMSVAPELELIKLSDCEWKVIEV